MVCGVVRGWCDGLIGVGGGSDGVWGCEVVV